MKRITLILLIGLILPCCDKDDLKVNLNANDDLVFSGTFEAVNSKNITGTVSLDISDGYYKCSTNLPYGNGAGKLEVNGTKINFIDTLFFPVPAIFGPAYVLSGEHQYEFDGVNLKIWRALNVGSVEYQLKARE